MTAHDHPPEPPSCYNKFRACRSTPPPSIPVDQTFGIGNLSEVEKSSFLFQPPDLGNQGSKAKEVIHISATCLQLSAQLQGRDCFGCCILHALTTALSLLLTWRDAMPPLT
jgi:hypothetical protein